MVTTTYIRDLRISSKMVSMLISGMTINMGFESCSGQQYFPIFHHPPHLSPSGCRFPGDVVCDTSNARNQLCNYRKCLLADENKNLWKKPTMALAAAVTCGADIGVLTEFCNNNKKLLVAIGFIKDKDGHHRPNHLSSITKMLDPCILVRMDPC